MILSLFTAPIFFQSSATQGEVFKAELIKNSKTLNMAGKMSRRCAAMKNFAILFIKITLKFKLQMCYKLLLQLVATQVVILRWPIT